MKNFAKEFIKRGFVSAWGGPIILATVYFILGKIGTVENLSVSEVSTGIFSITLMAFIAGGITSIYKYEKLSVAFSALIHAAVIYLDYLIMYLLNDWIPRNPTAIGIFSAFFFGGFALIWLIIYLCIKNQTDDINKLRSKKS